MPSCSTAFYPGCRVPAPQHPALSSCAAIASFDAQRSPKALRLCPHSPVPLMLTVLHASDVTLFDSPLTPALSSALLLWGEDPTQQGDRIAKQFWGDIFAKLPHHKGTVLDSYGHERYRQTAVVSCPTSRPAPSPVRCIPRLRRRSNMDSVTFHYYNARTGWFRRHGGLGGGTVRTGH